MGWLSDTVLGRARTVNMSLLFCWAGALIATISYCIQYSLCGLPVSVAKYGISVVALLLIMIGTAGYLCNVLAYGLDQLRESSTTRIRAFIHWIVWGIFVGYLMGYVAFVNETIYNPHLLIGTSLFVTFVSTIAVCLNLHFQNRFNLRGRLKKNNNPYFLVYRVLLFAYKNKHPIQRSSLTYWESDIPSRIDLAKTKYGGPFPEQDVDSVKSFWRIVIVLMAMFGFYIPYYIVVVDAFSYINIFHNGSTALNGYGSYLLWNMFDSQILILVPLFHLIIIPLWPKIDYFLLSPVRALGFTYILLLIMLILSMVINAVGYYHTSDHDTLSSSSCFRPESINLSYLYYSISLLFGGLLDCLSYIYGLELICSQATANMSGMLTGVFFMIRGMYSNLGVLIQLPFQMVSYDSGKYLINCSFWFLAIYFVICVIGFLVFIGTAKWYCSKRHDHFYSVLAEVETKYERRFQQRDIENNFNNEEAFNIDSP